MKKRLLSVIMAAVMMLTIAPYSALAAENETIVTEEVQSENSETTSDEVSGENSEDGSKNNSDGSSVEDENVLYDEDMDSSFLIDSEENIEEQPTENGSGLDEGFTATQAEENGGQEVAQSENSYEVSSGEELSNAFAQIASSEENEAVIVLKNDVTVMGDETSTSSFGVAGKHITVRSDESGMHKLSFNYRGFITGDTTFENVNVTGRFLYCNGYKTVFTSEGEINLSATLYGGGYKKDVESTYVVIAANGSINQISTGGLHDVIGGSYQASVEGDTYLEITGNIKMQGGNHLNPGCVQGDGTSGDSQNSPDVYVGGNAMLIYDNSNADVSPAIEGTYGCEMRGNVTLDVRSGRANEICGTQEFVDKSVIRGDLHIIAGSENYENSNRTLRLNSNWPIVGAGNRFATMPGAVGNYTVGGNITIDTFENVWSWDKGIDPTTDEDLGDLPEIYGALRGDVGGNITINAHGSHVENITGAAESSNVEGNVTINATNVELKNYYYEDPDYDEGDIFANYRSDVKGFCKINLDGGDVCIVRLTRGTSVNEGSEINITGSPKIRTGVLSTTNYSSAPTDTPVVNLTACTATIPFIQSAAKVNVDNNSDVTLNGLWFAKDLEIENGSSLKTDKDIVELEGNAVVNGTWEQLYVGPTGPDYDTSVAGTMTVGAEGKYISHGSASVEGDVTSSGLMALMKPSWFKGEYSGVNAELRLPVVQDGKNYNKGTIPLRISKLATGSTVVNTVKTDDWNTLQIPVLGDNYILTKKEDNSPEQSVFILGNDDAVKKDMFLLRTKDAANTDDHYMWQVATGISVIFDKNGGDTEASPRISSQEKTAEDASYKFALPTVNPTRKNFVFNGWNTKPDGTGTAFKANTEVTKSMTVYAQWKADESKLVTITPMDMTVYVGGNGYKGVIGSNGDFVVNDLPQMGCFVTFPDDINDFLGSEIDNPDDLSKHITLKYNNFEGTTRSWGFELYGDESNSTLTHNGRRTYIYKIMPSKIDGTTATVPARMQFTADDGTVMVESQFPESATDQYRDYKVNFYPGDLDEDLLTVEVTNGDKTIYRSVKLGTGTLKVRGNVDEIYAKVDYGTPKVDSQNEKAFLASAAQENTEYYINETGISVLDPSGVRLMVDSSLDDTFLKDYLNENKNADGKYSYEFKYFDLLDTNNGNAYVEMGSGQKMNVYWPVPEDAASNSQFHVVHFKALHRESDKDMNAILAQNPPTEENCEKVTIDGKEFIKFTVDSFSPFALMYQKKTSSSSSSGGSSHGSHESTMYILHYESNGGTEYKDENYASGTTVKLDKVPTRTGYTFDGWYADEELTQKITDIKLTGNKTVYAGWKATQIPSELNGENHFAYVVGYDDGTVRPKADISRAEVATIFFRLLKENVRDENLTADNVFGDVEKGKWYNKPVSTMAKIGIIKGRTARSFVPDAPITRAEFAAICSRFDNSNVEINSSFNDISGHWAEKEIERAASLGWIQGYTDGSFKPDRNITRAEAMAMINRMLHRLPESEEDLLNGMTKWPDNKPSDWYYINVQEATNSHDFERKGEINEKWTAIMADPNWEQYK